MQVVDMSSNPSMKRLVRCAFPSYLKRTCFASKFTPMGVNSFWEGESRDEYVIVQVATGTRVSLPVQTHPYFDILGKGLHGETPDVSVDVMGVVTLKRLPEGFVLVRGGIFSGKPATAHVYFNSEKCLAAVLGKDVVEATEIGE